MQDTKKRAQRILKQLKELFPEVKSALNYSNALEFLIAVVLSAQCTDKMVIKVTVHLFQKYQTLDDYVKADLTEFEQDIKSIGLYKSKAKNILAAVKIIKETYNGKIPDEMSNLLSLPGVGRKTANVVMGNIFGKPEGIAVDTHVRRLAKLYGLTEHTDPVKIEKDLMQLIPQKEWTNFTHLMIEYGRTYCPARAHNHKECPLVKILL